MIVNGNVGELTELQKYLHVVRAPEDALRRLIGENAQGSRLILLCGNVGDGKSHLLSHMGQRKLLGGFDLHNDATESFNPGKTNIETLCEQVLRPFADDRLAASEKRLILAINLGVLANFIEIAAEQGFSQLAGYIADSKVLTSNSALRPVHAVFSHVDFTADANVEIASGELTAPLFEQILDRIFLEDESNPFFVAFQRTRKVSPNAVVTTNFEFLLNTVNRAAFVRLLVQAVVKNKLVFSIRELLDFLAESVLSNFPDVQLTLATASRDYLPYAIFENGESPLQKAFQKNDPTRVRCTKADDVMFEIAAVNGALRRLNIAFGHVLPDWLGKEEMTDASSGMDLRTTCKLAQRNSFFATGGADESFDIEYWEFKKALCSAAEFIGDSSKYSGLQDFIDLLRRACECWHGDPHLGGYIVVTPPHRSSKYRLLRQFQIEVAQTASPKVWLRQSEFRIALNLNKRNTVQLHVDFEMFKIVYRVSQGYLPNRFDQQACVAMSAFVQTLISAGINESHVYVDRINAGGVIDYELLPSGFGIQFKAVHQS